MVSIVHVDGEGSARDDSGRDGDTEYNHLERAWNAGANGAAKFATFACDLLRGIPVGLSAL